MTRQAIENMLRAYGSPKVALFGVRGYYQDSMGVKGKNDRGLYDDAMFVIAPGVFLAFNCNTDPSYFRKGFGTSDGTKGMAMLAPGAWKYKRGLHKGLYPALIQAAPVTVYRDASEPPHPRTYYMQTGYHGLNIHHAGHMTTASLGCQTIPREQWDEFYNAVTAAMADAQIKEIPYILIENPDEDPPLAA